MNPFDVLKAVGSFVPFLKDGIGVAEAIIGKPVKGNPEDPATLKAAFDGMTPDEQAQWAAGTTAKLDLYKAETDRISVQDGVDPEQLNAMPKEQAGKLAWIRGSARPRIALMAAHALLLPVYMILVDGFLVILNGLIKLVFDTIIFFNGNPFGHPIPQMQLLADAFRDNTLYLDLYKAGVAAFTAVVITFMGVRQWDKSRQGAGKPGVADMIGGLVSKFKGSK